MDIDADKPLFTVPGRLDFVVDPLPAGGVFADEHDVAGLSVELLINPFLDRRVAAALDFFPIVVARGFVSLDHAHVADLGGSGAVGLVVETVEHSSCHAHLPFALLMISMTVSMRRLPS